MLKNSYFWWCVGLEQWNQRNFFYHRLCHLVLITPLHQTSQGQEIQADQSSYQLTSRPFCFFFIPLLSSLSFTTVSWTLLSVLCYIWVKNIFCSSSASALPVRPVNKTEFYWHTLPQAAVPVYTLFLPFFLSLSSTSHLCTAFDFWLSLKVSLAKNNSISNL